jgi:hypothetical protein
MIDKENALKTAQAVVAQYDLPLRIRSVEEGDGEGAKILFTAEKRIQLRELAQELELQLGHPVELERLKKSETGKIGGIDILGRYPCCAPFLRKCPFAGTYGCGYGFDKVSKCQSVKVSKNEKKLVEVKPQKRRKTEKKRKKKVVRRVVIK